MEYTEIKYDMLFEKKGMLSYISHLNLMMLFRRAIRRSDLPFILTKGFTPRVKISLPKALKLGVESDREELQVWFKEELNETMIKEKLNIELPEGVHINDVQRG
jgi:radical SAM-linked protein